VPSGGWRRLSWLGACLAVVGLSCWVPRWIERHHASMVVLPAGGGDSLWLNMPGQDGSLLLDCGDSRAVERVVQPFLQAQGVGELPHLILSHGDIRHVGGVTNLIETIRIHQAHAGPFPARSRAYRASIETLRHRAGRFDLVARPAEIGSWRILHPDRLDRFSQADDQAIVLRARLHGVIVLLCSDLGRLGQQALLDREPDLRADIVVAGMPSAAEPLIDAWLDALRPQVIVLSTGDYPPNQQPSRSLRVRLARRHLPIYYTGDHGAVTITIKPAGWEVRAVDETIPVTRGSRWIEEESAQR